MWYCNGHMWLPGQKTRKKRALCDSQMKLLYVGASVKWKCWAVLLEDGEKIWTSGDCSRSCGHCIEETCRVSDGYCYTRCQDGYWGSTCNNHCKNCVTDDEQCRMSDGYCYTGCKDGYWGANCDELCGCPAIWVPICDKVWCYCTDCDRYTGCPVLLWVSKK